jgi:hypothetical protein
LRLTRITMAGLEPATQQASVGEPMIYFAASK